MSASMVRAHGGSKDIVATQRGGGLILGGIVTDTMANSPKKVHMRSLENLIAKTTGTPREEPIMEGVIASTVPTHMRDVPELQPMHDKNMTISKMASGTPYSGPKSGYGDAKRHGDKKKGKKY